MNTGLKPWGICSSPAVETQMAVDDFLYLAWNPLASAQLCGILDLAQTISLLVSGLLM